MSRFVAQTEQAHATRADEVKAGLTRAARQVEGMLMEKQALLKEKTQPLVKSVGDHREQLLTALMAILLAASAWWWMRRRVRA